MQLVNGSVYLWGNISGYVVSYYHYKGDVNATLSMAVLLIPANYMVTGFLYPIGAKLQKRVNPKLIILVGYTISVGSLYFSSRADSWWNFVIIYAGL